MFNRIKKVCIGITLGLTLTSVAMASINSCPEPGNLIVQNGYWTIKGGHGNWRSAKNNYKQPSASTNIGFSYARIHVLKSFKLSRIGKNLQCWYVIEKG